MAGRGGTETGMDYQHYDQGANSMHQGPSEFGTEFEPQSAERFVGPQEVPVKLAVDNTEFGLG